MFDSVKNLFKKKKNEGEKDKEKDKEEDKEKDKEKDKEISGEEKKVEKALEELIQNSNSEQNTTAKSFNSSIYYLENIQVERRIISEILKDEINSVDPVEMFRNFYVKIQNWKYPFL